MSDSLPWTLESASHRNEGGLRWSHAGSNLCLDFHGDPLSAGLVVFSDGNHHMALEAILRAFRSRHTNLDDIFYTTTPPGVLLDYLEAGHLWLGNLCLTCVPDIFISPPEIMARLQQDGHIDHHQPFMRSRGNVLLVRKGNPNNIQSIADVIRDDVRLFISNPHTETTSYEVYSQSLVNLASAQELDSDALQVKIADSTRTLYGERIHHREAPQALYNGRADVAMVYYHLALRYTRIFPNDFDFIPLGGSKDNPQPPSGNICTTYHIARLKTENRYSAPLMEFVFDKQVTGIIQTHGLERIHSA